MPRLIDADALADRLDALAYDDWNQGVSVSWADAFKVSAEMVRDERAVESEPVRHGRWEKPQRHGVISYDEHAYAECSCCHKAQYLARGMNYCPNCGAKMDEVEDG